MKETYEGIDDLLMTTARKIVSEITDHDLELNVIYFPQIGFLVTIPATNADGLVEEGSLEEGKWERMFTSNNQVYYKEFRTKEMDDTFGDIYALICGMT
jgi:DNA mismatch repair protein MSH5